jgi:hypothetical protein
MAAATVAAMQTVAVGLVVDMAATLLPVPLKVSLIRCAPALT